MIVVEIDVDNLVDEVGLFVDVLIIVDILVGIFVAIHFIGHNEIIDISHL